MMSSADTVLPTVADAAEMLRSQDSVLEALVDQPSHIYELRPVTLTFAFDPDIVKMNRSAKYLGQRSSRLKVTGPALHAHTDPIATCLRPPKNLETR